MNRNDLKVKRTALIDGDVLVYTAAAGAKSRGQDSAELCERVLDEVRWWSRRAFCENTIVAFSCKRTDNYRRDFWPEYKAHRDDSIDPPFLKDAISAVKGECQSITRPRIEADDLLGILGTDAKPLKDGTVPVIVTRDKDLRQIPGWHFNPEKEDFPVWVSRADADFFFYQQWITGDATDNIPGIFRVGPKKAQYLLEHNDPSCWDEVILEGYLTHPKGYNLDYALAMARCARILRAGEWDKEKAVPILWTPKLPTVPTGGVAGDPA